MTELGAPRLTCRELVALLTDHLDDALAPADSARVEAHLATCPGCTAHLEQVRATIAAIARLREDDISQAVLEELMPAFRAWSAGRS